MLQHYHVNKNDVQAIWSYPDKHIVAFVDDNKKGYEPQYMLTVNESLQIILASSPKGAGGM